MNKVPEQKKNQKKIRSKKNILVKKIIFSFLLFLIVLIVFSSYIKYTISNMSNTKSKMISTQKSIDSISVEEKEMERKAYLTKVYIELWKDEMEGGQKSIKGIDIEKIKQLFTLLSDNNHLMNLKTSLSLPMSIDFQKTSVDIVNSEITLTLNCLTEYSVYNFLKQLDISKIGFFIVEEVKIKKIKNLDKNILNNLINGVLDYMYEASVKLQWYNAMEKKR